MITPSSILKLAAKGVRRTQKRLSCGEDGKHMVDPRFWRCIRCNEPVAVMLPAKA